MVERPDINNPDSTFNSVETVLLARWQRMDFSTWNEQEVREGFIIHLLAALGYRKGGTYDLELEKELKLSEPYHRIGRRKVAIDYAPSVRLRHFWIIEAKPGTQDPMRYGDILQAHLYAIHPDVQARFIVLCNGWEVRVYDAMTVRSYDDALHVCRRDDCGATFVQLRNILGAEHMLEFQRQRLIDIARDSLKVEVDIERFQRFRQNITRLLHEGESLVRDNARKLQSDQFFKSLESEQKELLAVTLEELFVRLDLPERPSRQATNEFARRAKQGNQAERDDMVEKLFLQCMGRPHNIFRAQTLRVLVDLLKGSVSVGPTRFISSLPKCIDELARWNIEHWASSYISGPLVRLDNAAMRVAYKFCTRVGMGFMEAFASELRRSLTPEQRVAQQPSAAGMMIPSVGHAQEILWRKYCSGRLAANIEEGVWTYQSIERELDELPVKEYSDGDFDFLFFEGQGVTCSQLRTATWNIVRENVDLLRSSGIGEDVLAFARLEHREVCEGTPKESSAPAEWKSTLGLRELTEEILPPVLRVRALGVLDHLLKNREG